MTLLQSIKNLWGGKPPSQSVTYPEDDEARYGWLADRLARQTGYHPAGIKEYLDGLGQEKVASMTNRELLATIHEEYKRGQASENLELNA